MNYQGSKTGSPFWPEGSKADPRRQGENGNEISEVCKVWMRSVNLVTLRWIQRKLKSPVPFCTLKMNSVTGRWWDSLSTWLKSWNESPNVAKNINGVLEWAQTKIPFGWWKPVLNSYFCVKMFDFYWSDILILNAVFSLAVSRKWS